MWLLGYSENVWSVTMRSQGCFKCSYAVTKLFCVVMWLLGILNIFGVLLCGC